jgi:hypothetical protein
MIEIMAFQCQEELSFNCLISWWASRLAHLGTEAGAPCGAWCAPPASLLGNITASQNAFGDQIYGQWEQQALIDLAAQQASVDPAVLATCIATGLESTFPTAASVNGGTPTEEDGGHSNFDFQLAFSSQVALDAFSATYPLGLNPVIVSKTGTHSRSKLRSG